LREDDRQWSIAIRLQHGEGGMRFIWFNLMPWPYLPEDFREKYRSVWVDIPSSLYDPVRGHEVYNDYLDQLEFAETVGLTDLGSTSTTPTLTA
jgi:hypothetical protein